MIKTSRLNEILDEINEEDTLVTAKTVRIAAVILCVISVLISLFFTDIRVFTLGIFLGGAVAQLLFRQHELTIKKSIANGNAGNVTVTNYILRLLIRGITVGVAIFNPNVSIVGCVLGLLSIPYSIYALAFLDHILHKKNGKEE